LQIKSVNASVSSVSAGVSSRTSIIGLIFQTASILLGFGLALMLILPLDFSYDYMSASSLIVYNLICTAVTYFAVNMKQM
jgi:Cu+-exporting ATPase